MIKLKMSKREKSTSFFKSKLGLILSINLGLAIVGLTVFYVVNLPVRVDNKITFNISIPSNPNLEKQEVIPTLSINFDGSVSKIDDVQTDIVSGIAIFPEIKGVWKWATDDRIVFQPFDQWMPGTEYKVKMEKELFPDHIKLNKYEKSFTTRSFKVSIASSSFHIDPVDEDLKQVIATVKFSHPIDPVEFEEKASLKPYKLDNDIYAFKDQEYKFEVTYDDFYSKAYIVSEALPIPEDDVQMRLTIEDGLKSSWGGNEYDSELKTTVTVPGMLNFVRINSIDQTIVRNEKYESEQVLVIDTKGKATSSELLKNIEIFVLPVDRPEMPGTKAQKNHYWSDVAEIGPEIKKLSSPVRLKAMESVHEYENVNSYKLNVEPLRYVYIKIKKGTQFYGKYNLSKDFEKIIRIKTFPEHLEIMHDGIILSSTGDKKISIMSQGIKKVRFRIGRVLPDEINHLVTQSNGNLTNLRFNNYNFSEDNIVENYSEYRNLEVLSPSETNFFSFDFSRYLSNGANGKVRNGIFFFEVESERTYSDRSGSESDKRLIIVSDLGVLVKENANEDRDLFVQSIRSGLPVADAKVQVLGKNGIPVLSAYTNANGHVAFPSLNSFRNEKMPTAFVISKGNDLSFLPVKASGRWLNYSKFDIGGVHGASNPNKLNAYLFSERGIYRPGDEFNIGMIVKAGDWKRNINGTPLEVSISDSRGLEIFKKRFKLNYSGFDEIKYKTESSSPTGTYQINLYTIRNKRRYSSIGSTTISVEEFLPDRLTISSIFPGIGDKAWVSPEEIKGLVTLRNLFGSPAKGNRISARISFSPGRMWFPAFKDYRFSDPMSSRISYSETLADQITNDQGKATFDLDLERFDAATYNLTFIADGFEKESGRNVTTVSSVLVSPLKYLIGTKANGDLSYIYKDSKRTVKTIAINSSLNQVSVDQLQFVVNRIDQISVLTKMPNGVYEYKSVPKEVTVSDLKKKIPASGLDFELPTNEPGEYKLIIKNSDGVEFSSLHYSVVGMGNITRNLDKTAELEIKLNKSDYDPGEEIEVFVKAPYKGAGIITIEKDKVYHSQWFKSESNSFLKKIKIPEDLEGNGYINISFVRAADSKNIYMTPLSYGVAPFAISKKNRMNKITLDIPSKARSGKVFPIKYKTEKPCKIVVFAVDEGILQVANYQTPNPLSHFFKKSALEVKTSQLLDLILPDYSLSQHVSAMGGGAGYDEIGKNLNPFKRKQNKPVVYWSGILDADPNTRKLEYTVPDYFNGTLRVMAVAVSADAIGTKELKAIVKNPFVISPNVPMYAAPSDSLEVTVTVTNTWAGSGKNLPINLEVIASPHFKVYPTNRSLKLSEDNDTTIRFKVKVNKKLGAASLTFKASSKGESAKLASYLSVRPAIPYRSTVLTGKLKDEKKEVETPRKMYEEYRVLNTSVSFLPLGLSKGLVQYLDKYPYGCTEQIVSQSFPYLFLKNITGYNIDKSTLNSKTSYALKVLQARQNGQGKFGIWAANSHSSDFITVYGAHYITQCKKLGYYVSESLYDRTIEALKDIAQRADVESTHELRTQAYAIYILTMNEIITTNYISSLRRKLDQSFKKWETDLTAAYIGASYILMKQDEQGKELIEDLAEHQFEKQNQDWSFYDGLIHDAQLLYLISLHMPSSLEDVSDNIIEGIAKELQNGNYNTLNSSYSIMALSAFSNASKEPASGKIKVNQIFKDDQAKPLSIPSGKFPVVDFSDKAQKLQFIENGNQTAYYQVVQSGYDLQLPTKRISNSIEISRTFKNLDGSEISKAELGEEIEVHIKLRSLTDRTLHNIAIVDLLPAGLEVSASEVRDNTDGNWEPDYIDIREDRVVAYGSVPTKINEIIYKVRAINKGTFIVPPLYGESMYDRKIFGYSPNESFIVE
jgi:uncharacterized protein YfaS (alpha-2-macroglobulin family)